LTVDCDANKRSWTHCKLRLTTVKIDVKSRENNNFIEGLIYLSAKVKLELEFNQNVKLLIMSHLKFSIKKCNTFSFALRNFEKPLKVCHSLLYLSHRMKFAPIVQVISVFFYIVFLH
jgi:hypothetical protein